MPKLSFLFVFFIALFSHAAEDCRIEIHRAQLDTMMNFWVGFKPNSRDKVRFFIVPAANKFECYQKAIEDANTREKYTKTRLRRENLEMLHGVNQKGQPILIPTYTYYAPFLEYVGWKFGSWRTESGFVSKDSPPHQFRTGNAIIKD